MIIAGDYTPCISNSLWVNFSPPSAAYMRQWIGSALVQIVAFRLFDAKPFSKLVLECCQLDHQEQIQWNFNQSTKRIIHENAYENIVWEMAAISFRGKWVNASHPPLPPNHRPTPYPKLHGSSQRNEWLNILGSCDLRIRPWTRSSLVCVSRQAITWTNDNLLSVWTLGTNLGEVSIKTYPF